MLMSTNNVCFCGERRKYQNFEKKKRLYLKLCMAGQHIVCAVASRYMYVCFVHIKLVEILTLPAEKDF